VPGEGTRYSIVGYVTVYEYYAYSRQVPEEPVFEGPGLDPVGSVPVLFAMRILPYQKWLKSGRTILFYVQGFASGT
jgi:hypothetical protein